MLTYIALLRGINVSGQKLIKMADLKQFLAELNFENIITYIQSGNIIFKSRISDKHKLEKLISKKINEHYGFEVEVLIKTPNELEYILLNNSFIKQNKDPKRNYITFLFSKPLNENVEKLSKIDHMPEEYIIDEKNVFFFSPNSYGNAKMNNNYFEKKLKVFATTRNWQTVNKLFELATIH
ncbi:MAG: DUF1697 domain-containing protein [Melioribacteraceae bacterium]